MKQGYMEFHFRDPFRNENVPVVFSNPIATIEAREIEEVRPKMREVESYVEQGYFAAGYVSYEAAPAFHSKMKTKKKPIMPLLSFSIYREFDELEDHTPSQVNTSFNWTPNVTKEKYEKDICTIHDEIENGNTYQVNYTTRLNVPFEEDDYVYFKQLKDAQQGDYSSYINLGDFSILSASPELFFAVQNNRIVTKPMKGTTKRGLTFEEDIQLKASLTTSQKEQAENVMIVDLIRNDLGRIAKSGSVNVSKLFEVETYPTVHQLTSTIEADLTDMTSITDIFTALFPCGSITGAPKISTMEIIDQLEDSPREVYCGSMGYITPERKAIFNIPIRTVWIDHNTKKAEYGVGGGITWDSNANGEFEEMITKGKILSTVPRQPFYLLESMLLENGGYTLLQLHLERLQKSAQYFQFDYEEEKIVKALCKLRDETSDETCKVRLLVAEDGEVKVEAHPISLSNEKKEVRIAESPVDRRDPFLYHKTTNRSIYEPHKDDRYYDTLLWNEKGFITEFINGNIVVEKEGHYYTPPVEDGLLPGTFRQAQMNAGIVLERTFSIQELQSFDRIWHINSVRGWTEVFLNM
ncbi:aminodeoxychorismate synthase component I [Salirhabdus salicampi]|uniref:aminodeoxychorismate synthase component I n=1 Tax=Salirhabdus salicampi TaxID=476102 RepID=UPI0020C25F6A|nr:aminodeoxychorismate synthase component I [Salirhabdus salicampi]MCP8615702.1 aminodeoxychorismate synthase component I [Salirhabdus salicampi]